MSVSVTLRPLTPVSVGPPLTVGGGDVGLPDLSLGSGRVEVERGDDGHLLCPRTVPKLLCYLTKSTLVVYVREPSARHVDVRVHSRP